MTPIKFENVNDLLVMLSNLPKDMPLKAVGWRNPQTLNVQQMPVFGIVVDGTFNLCAEYYEENDFENQDLEVIADEDLETNEPVELPEQVDKDVLPNRQQPNRANMQTLSQLLG